MPPIGAIGQGPLLWGSPEEIPVDLDNIFGTPRLARQGDRMVITVVTVEEDPEAPDQLPRRDVHVIESVGGSWTAVEALTDVESHRRAVNARPAFDAQGVGHVLWQERDRETGGETVLLHARQDQGAWGTPDTIAVQLRPPQIPPPNPVLDGQGRLHIAFSAEPAPNALPRLVHGLWEGERFNERNIIRERGGVGPEMIRGRSGRLIAAFLAGDPQPGTTDENSVFFTLSDDEGESWREALRIAPRSGNRRASQLALAEAPDGRIHVMWARDLTGDGFPNALEHVHSMDGECWSEPERLDLPTSGPSWAPVRAVADGGGGLHLLFRHSLDHWTSEVSYLRYGYWNGEDWSALEPILNMDDAGEIDMVQDDQGTVHLIFVARELSQERSRLYLVRAGADS